MESGNLKKNLKAKILGRRITNNLDELMAESKQRRIYKLRPDEIQKANRRRERNKISATNSRLKQEEKFRILQQTVKQLEEENSSYLSDCVSLKMELLKLTNILNNHKDCKLQQTLPKFTQGIENNNRHATVYATDQDTLPFIPKSTAIKYGPGTDITSDVDLLLLDNSRADTYTSGAANTLSFHTTTPSPPPCVKGPVDLDQVDYTDCMMTDSTDSYTDHLSKLCAKGDSIPTATRDNFSNPFSKQVCHQDSALTNNNTDWLHRSQCMYTATNIPPMDQTESVFSDIDLDFLEDNTTPVDTPVNSTELKELTTVFEKRSDNVERALPTEHFLTSTYSSRVPKNTVSICNQHLNVRNSSSCSPDNLQNMHEGSEIGYKRMVTCENSTIPTRTCTSGTVKERSEFLSNGDHLGNIYTKTIDGTMTDMVMATSSTSKREGSVSDIVPSGPNPKPALTTAPEIRTTAFVRSNVTNKILSMETDRSIAFYEAFLKDKTQKPLECFLTNGHCT